MIICLNGFQWRCKIGSNHSQRPWLLTAKGRYIEVKYTQCKSVSAVKFPRIINENRYGMLVQMLSSDFKQNAHWITNRSSSIEIARRDTIPGKAPLTSKSWSHTENLKPFCNFLKLSFYTRNSKKNKQNNSIN